MASKAAAASAAAAVADEPDNRQTYVAQRSLTYKGPKLTAPPPIDTQRPRSADVIYVGADGKLYDKHYIVIESTAPKKGPLFHDVPNPNDYFTFVEYEDALMRWKVNVEQKVKKCRLPHVLGRFYMRPRVAKALQDASVDDASSTKSDASTDAKSTASSTKSEGESDAAPLQQQVVTIDSPLDRDPWEALLVPQEPQPEYYPSFEEYEEALCRWAVLVNRVMPVLPPHASQLHELIPLQYVAAKQNRRRGGRGGDEDDDGVDAKAISRRKLLAGLHIVVPFFEPMQLGMIRLPPAIAPEATQDQWRELSARSKKMLNQVFADMLDNSASARTQELMAAMNELSVHALVKPERAAQLRELFDEMSKFAQFKQQQKPLLPVIHGTFPKLFAKPQLKSKMPPLRRLDLSPEMRTTTCYDCKPTINGVQIEFHTPITDIEGVDWRRIQADPDYYKECVKQLAKLRSASRYDYLNSWYHPRLVSQHTTQAHRREVLDIIEARRPGKPLSTRQLCDILSGRMHLDQFIALVAEGIGEDEEGAARTYMQEMLDSVTQENFGEILQLYESHSEALVHAKVSAFVVESLQTTRAKLILEQIIKNGAISTLSRVAFALFFNEEIPREIFPYRETTVRLVEEAFGRGMREIVKQVFIVYYVSLINETISKQTYLYVAITQFIAESRKAAIALLEKALAAKGPGFIRSCFAQGLGHRSASVAYFVMFILVQLMNNSDSQYIREYLRKPEASLVFHVRKLCYSKFYHSQFIAKRLFGTLSTPAWISTVYAHYNSNHDYIKEDLCPPPMLDTVSSLLSSLVLALCRRALRSATPENCDQMSFLINDGLFHFLLKRLITTKPPYPQSLETVARVLVMLSKTFHRLGLLTLRDKKEKKEKIIRKVTISIGSDDVSAIIQFFSDAAPRDAMSPVLKNLLLSTLRYLFRDKEIYETVQGDKKMQKAGTAPEFYNKLTEFMRESVSNDLNENGWRTFYQLIRYHTGQLDYLIKANVLNQVLEIVGTSSGNQIIMNSLKYIVKLFNMANSEQRRTSYEGRAFSRADKDIKSMQKDVKTLSEYFVDRSVFIKLHMIFKRFIPTFPGRPFQELVQLYVLINTSPACSKIQKEALKKPEYKDGLDKLCSMRGYTGAEAQQSAGGGGGGASHASQQHTSAAQHHATVRQASSPQMPTQPAPAVKSSKSGKSIGSLRIGKEKKEKK